MNSLEILAKRWKSEDLDALPPYGPAIIRATFLEAGIEPSKDILYLYGLVGGMAVPDGKWWRLWPLSEVAERKSEGNAFGVLFSDYLIDSWVYRIKPVDADTSAVYVDYYDGRDAILVAATLEQFFDMYVENADRLLNQAN